MASYDITADSELRDRVRSLTNYEDSPDELPQSRLKELTDSAKLELELRTGSTAWYSDKGLGHALVGLTAIKSKNSVENFSVSVWDVLGQTIDVSGVSDPDASQFEQWAGMVQTGLANSSATDEGDIPTGIVSNSYIG